MSAWALIVFVMAANGGATSAVVEMTDYAVCSVAKNEIEMKASYGRDEDKPALIALCVKRTS